MQLGNGTWEKTQFNSRLQPTQIALGKTPGATNLLKLDYSYGDWVSGSINTAKNNGNIVQQVITVPNVGQSENEFTATQKYYYDSLNRIDDATEHVGATQTWRQDFTFDRYGNRNFNRTNTTMPASFANPAVTDPAISTSNNRITSTGWLYDSAGNTTRDGNYQTFTYDGENKQVVVKNSSNVTIGEYWYDGDGKRVKKKAYDNSTGALTEETIFVYDASGKLIEEYSTNVADLGDAEVAYLTNDHLGSPRINTDRDGNVISRHDYHPFGEEISTNERSNHPEYTPDSVRKQFTGYERDGETELDFAQARMHSYTNGRFTTPDPYKIVAEIKVETTDEKAEAKLHQYLSIPQRWNSYSYSLNNPIRYTDPSGEDIYIVGRDEKERANLLKKLEKVLGEDRMRTVTIEYKKDSKLGDVISLSFINEKKENQMAMIGTGDEGILSVRMADIIGSNEVVEFRSGSSYETKSGKTISLKSEGGGSTIGSNESATGNVQVWIHPTYASGYAYENANTVFQAGKSNDGKPLDFADDETVVAHEFGHAHQGLNRGDVNSAVSMSAAVRMENTYRARNPRNSQRRTRH